MTGRARPWVIAAFRGAGCGLHGRRHAVARRAIDVIDPVVAVAALVDVPVAAGAPARTWFVLSRQPELAADPWLQPELAAVLGPAE